MANFNLTLALHLSPLEPVDQALITQKCTNESVTLSELSQDPKLLQVVLDHLPSDLKTTDRPLLFQIVKIAEGSGNFQGEMLQKIQNIAQIIAPGIPITLLDKLKTIISDFNTSSKGVPNLPKLRDNIRTAIWEAYQDPNQSIEGLHEFCTLILKKSFPAQMIPKITTPIENFMESIVMKFYESQSSAAGSKKITAETEKFFTAFCPTLSPVLHSDLVAFVWKMAMERLGTIRDLLYANMNHEALNELVRLIGFLNGLKFLKDAPDIYIKSVDNVAKALTERFNNCLDELLLQSTLKSTAEVDAAKLDALEGDTAPVGTEVKETPKAEEVSKAEDKSLLTKVETLNAKLEILMRMFHILPKCLPASDTPPNWESEFKSELWTKLSKSFGLIECQKQAEKCCFNDQIKALFKVMAEMMTLIDKKTFTLQEFIASGEKAYLYLLPIRMKLREEKVDLIFITLAGFLSGLVMDAELKCKSNSEGQFLDFSKGENILLKKKLTTLLQGFSLLLGCEMEVQVKMKTANDGLFAILYQLISSRYKSTPQTVPTIREWINNNSNSPLDAFQEWIGKKIKTRAKLTSTVLTRDPGTLYKLFLKENPAFNPAGK